MSKFDNIGNEPDTKILFSILTKFGEYDILYQKWLWSGIKAESLIFANDDISNISMVELENDIRYSPLVNDISQEITTSSKNSFTFFNFNFVVDDDGL